jgi:hypothetical protein
VSLNRFKKYAVYVGTVRKQYEDDMKQSMLFTHINPGTGSDNPQVQFKQGGDSPVVIRQSKKRKKNKSNKKGKRAAMEESSSSDDTDSADD